MGRSLGCGKLPAVAFLHLKSCLMDLDMPDEIMPILFCRAGAGPQEPGRVWTGRDVL